MTLQTPRKRLYIGGSLRNPDVLEIAKLVNADYPQISVFADWMCAGPHADDAWRDYEKSMGFTYIEALLRPAAKNVFQFDKKHLDISDAFLLVLPCGRSAHMELGYMVGTGKSTCVLIDDPERWDVMYQFADTVVDKFGDVREWLKLI